MKTIKSIYHQIFDFPGDTIPRTTAQQKGYNRTTGVHYQKSKVTLARNFYTIELKKAMRNNGIETAFDGPVSLSVLFIYKSPVKKQSGHPKLTRPDCDNSVKLIQDCFVDAGAIVDDSQIFDLHVVKIWGPENRVDIMARFVSFEEDQKK